MNGGSVLIPPHGRQLESEMDDGSQPVEKEEVGLSKAPRLYPIAPGPFTSLSIVNSPQALLAPTFLIGFTWALHCSAMQGPPSGLQPRM